MGFKLRRLVESGPGWWLLAISTVGALAMSREMPRWLCMWSLSGCIYFGFKYWTWRLALAHGVKTTNNRSLGYLFLWPGMDAPQFLRLGARGRHPRPGEWVWSMLKTAFGVGLLWGLSGYYGAGLLAGWIGMVGLIFVLHFGTFSLLALGWQALGVRAEPLMRAPALPDSLADFWGKRWNSAFRDLSFNLLFRPLRQRTGPRWAVMLTFLISGLIHDLVISVPAGAGYGLPTLYFVIQGGGVLLEHSALNGWTGRRGRWSARLLTLLIVIAPVPLLFHPAFVLRVIVPFMQVIKAV